MILNWEMIWLRVLFRDHLRAVYEIADTQTMTRTSRRLIWYLDRGQKGLVKTTRVLLPRASSTS